MSARRAGGKVVVTSVVDRHLALVEKGKLMASEMATSAEV
jgi:hypothetical protein